MLTPTEGLRYTNEHVIPRYENIDTCLIPQPGEPGYEENPRNHPDPSTNPSNNPSRNDTEPTNSIDDPDDPSVDPSFSIDSCDPSDPSVPCDPKDPILTNSIEDHSEKCVHDTGKYKKVTEKQNNLKKPKRNDLSDHKKVSRRASSHSTKSTHRDHLQGDPGARKSDPVHNLSSSDLSDHIDDLTSDSDFSDFENITLGQVLGRNTGHVRKDR